MAQAVGGPVAVSPAHARLQPALAAALVIAVYAVAAALPLVHLVVSFAADAGRSLALLASPRPWELLSRSLGIAGATTALALAAGIPLGFSLGRLAIPGRRGLLALHTFVFFLPPFVPALGWFHVFGRSGYLGGPATSALLFGAGGVVFVLGLAFVPVVTALVALAVSRLDPSLEEAALLVASPWRMFRRISLPLALPAVFLAAFIVFALTLSELGVPMFLRVDVFPAAVFARLGGIDFAPAEAVALSLPLCGILVMILFAERRLGARRAIATLGVRHPGRRPLRIRRGHAAVTAATWIVALLPLLPLLALVPRAIGGASLQSILTWAGHAPVNSVICAALAASLGLVIAIVAGHGAARGQAASLALDAATLVGFMLPAAVLGLGLIATWNRPATQPIYASSTIVVVAFVARYAAVALRVAATTFSQIPGLLEQAAQSAGASYVRRLLRIVAPLNRRGLGAAWIGMFVFCLRDLETAVLLYPPGGETLTVRIFTLEANGPPAVVAGLALLQVLLTAAAVAAGGILLGARGRW